MSKPSVSKRIDLVITADGGRQVLVNGQDITWWIDASSNLSVDFGEPKTLPKMTLTLTANEIRTRQERTTPM